MNVKTITITYGEKRTGSYQAVDHAISVEIELTDKDDIAQVLGEWREWARNEVTDFTGPEIVRLIAEANGAPRHK